MVIKMRLMMLMMMMREQYEVGRVAGVESINPSAPLSKATHCNCTPLFCIILHCTSSAFITVQSFYCTCSTFVHCKALYNAIDTTR